MKMSLWKFKDEERVDFLERLLMPLKISKKVKCQNVNFFIFTSNRDIFYHQPPQFINLKFL